MKNRILLLHLSLALLALALVGCDKRQPPAGASGAGAKSESGINVTVASPAVSLLPGKPRASIPSGYWNETPDKKIKLLYALAADAALDCVPPLLELFGSETNPEVKEAIIETVVEKKDLRALDAFGAAAEPAQPKKVRLAALSALGELGDKRALPYVQKHLADPDPEIREAASFEVEYLKAEPARGKIDLNKSKLILKKPAASQPARKQ